MKKLLLIFVFGLVGCQQKMVTPHATDLVIQPVEAVSQTEINAKAEGSVAKIMFVGDLMFDRYIRQMSNQKGCEYILSEVRPLFESADLVVGNLEGPITNFKSISLGTVYESSGSAHFTFTFDPQVADVLKQSGFDLLNLGNNHILNFGPAGVEQTLEFTKEAGLGTFGYINQDQQSIYQTTLVGKKLIFANWNQFSNQNLDSFLNQLKTLDKQADILIVYTHWSEEYQFNPTPLVRAQAHQMIEAGADVIIGSHPHVVGEVETYQGKQIYYSLGNFVFDQYFSPETQIGLVVEMEIYSDAKTIIFKDHKVQLLPSGQTVLF